MKDIHWLFFDIGSTLVVESKAYAHRLMTAAEKAGVSYEYVHQTAVSFSRMNKPGDKEVMKLLHVDTPMWKAEYEFLYPDAEACLKALSGHYRLGIIANQSPGTADRLEAFGIRKYFDLIIASAEEGIAKPDRRIFESALAKAGCLPGEAVMIGDRIDNDIIPAKKIGMKTVRVMQGFGRYWSVTCEDERADFTADSLSGIIGFLLPDR